jgi:hypothetical protein
VTPIRDGPARYFLRAEIDRLVAGVAPASEFTKIVGLIQDGRVIFFLKAT